jgi:hypothetical protein
MRHLLELPIRSMGKTQSPKGYGENGVAADLVSSSVLQWICATVRHDLRACVIIRNDLGI